MQKLRFALAVLLVVIFPLSRQYENDNSDEADCSTWMYHARSSDNTTHCVCGTSYHFQIICDSNHKELRIVDGLAMTYDEDTNKVIAGHTLFGWTKKSTKTRDEVYRKVPLNKTSLNDDICGQFHREGQLCGACEEDHTPQIYMFDFHCKRCSKSENDWMSLLVLTFVPITLFYIFAVLFKFNANSPNIHAYVLAAQLIYSPQVIRFYSVQYHKSIIGKVFIFTYGIWNFDFLSVFNTSFCIQLTTLQTLAFGYVTPCYALLVMMLTYIAIELHSKGCKIMLLISSTFQKCTHCLKMNYNGKSSIISVFATFLLLSYNRLLSTHIDLLLYVEPFDHTGTKIGKFLYYDPTVEYFGREHYLYGILAILIGLLCSLLPLLLLLFYPMKWFQKCLNGLKLNRYGLHIFVDSFAGCYKDGTEPGTRDCRYFAALFLLLRILTYLVISVFTITCAIAINGIIIMLFMAFFVSCQPYKAKYAVYNRITGLMLVLMSAMNMALLGALMSQIKTLNYMQFSFLVLIVLMLIPQLYISALTLRWLFNLVHAHKSERRTLLLSHKLKHYGGL